VDGHSTTPQPLQYAVDQTSLNTMQNGQSLNLTLFLIRKTSVRSNLMDISCILSVIYPDIAASNTVRYVCSSEKNVVYVIYWMSFKTRTYCTYIPEVPGNSLLLYCQEISYIWSLQKKNLHCEIFFTVFFSNCKTISGNVFLLNHFFSQMSLCQLGKKVLEFVFLYFFVFEKFCNVSVIYHVNGAFSHRH